MLENNYINLFLGVPDTDFSKLIEGAIETGSIYAEIYKKIEVLSEIFERRIFSEEGFLIFFLNILHIFFNSLFSKTFLPFLR